MTKVKMVMLIGLVALGAVYAGIRPEGVNRIEINKSLVKGAIRAMNRGDFVALTQVYSRNFVQHQPGGRKKIGWVEFEMGCRLAKNKLPTWHCEIVDIIEEGDKVAVRLKTVFEYEERYEGNVRQHAKMVLTEIDIFRIEGGKIVEEWCEGDYTGVEGKIRAIIDGRLFR